MTDEPSPARFLTIVQAAEELNVNQNQIRVLLRTGSLVASRSVAGACGIGANYIEDYIVEAYQRTAERTSELKDDRELGTEET